MILQIDILVMAFDVVCSHQYKLSMDALFCFVFVIDQLLWLRLQV